MPTNARLLSWLQQPAHPRRLGCVLACLLLTACGTHGTTSGDTTTGELFARGIDQITDLYIEPISGQMLVIVGAKNLAKLDPRLAASLDHGTLTLTYDGIVVGSYQVPADTSGTVAGETIAGVIAAAKKASGHIHTLPEDVIDKAVFDGMTGALDRFSHRAAGQEARPVLAADRARHRLGRDRQHGARDPRHLGSARA